MIHQYLSYGRAKEKEPVTLLKGHIPVGTIIYIQDNIRPLGGVPRFFSPVKRNPWIVEAWHPRNSAFLGPRHNEMFLATVHSLRDGRRKIVADWLLQMSLDLTD